jgi:hypothetical protein
MRRLFFFVLLLSVEASAQTAPTTFWRGYRTLDTIYSQLSSYASTYPQLAELVDYGDSYAKTVGGLDTPGGDHLAGFDLLAIRVTNESVGPKPRLFIMASMHARELPPTEIAMRFLDWLLTGYGVNADATWIVDNRAVWIVPIANPDGRWMVELGTKPPYSSTPFRWRKNTNPSYGGGAWPPTFYEHFGVDLNRNHSFKWGGGAKNPEAWSYRGPGPASEPETVALENFVRSLFPDQRGPNITDKAPDDTTGVLLSLHTGMEAVLWPWCYSTNLAPNHDGLSVIGQKLAALNGTKTLNCGISGSTDDFAYGELGIAAFTIELLKPHDPGQATVQSVWNRNLPALIHAAKIADAPYRSQ